MPWILFAILSSAAYAVTNCLDKYILDFEIKKDYSSLVVYTAIVSFIFGGLYWIFAGFPILIVRDAILVIITGLLTIFGLALYFRALSLEETSTVIVLMQMVPVITLALSTVFLNERISGVQIIGFMLILGAVMGVSINKEHLQVKLSKALFLVLLADFLWASANVIFKFVISSTTFSQLIAYESLGITLGGLVIFLFSSRVRNRLTDMCWSLRKIALGILLLNEIIFIVAKLLGFYAISLGPVSLVGVIGSTQVFFGIFYEWILSFITKKPPQEKISTINMPEKLALALLMFFGIWLIQY